MAAISSVASKGSFIINKTPESRYWTDVKVQKAWLTASASIALIGSAATASLAIASSAVWLGVSIPLLILAFGLVYYTHNLIDYEDPATIQKIRAEASRMPLIEIVLKHGWSKLFRYEILDPLHFEMAYRSMNDSLPFGRLLQIYHEARSHLGGARYSLPSPSDWKSKFDKEASVLHCDQILDQYPLKDLIEFRIIAPQQQEALEAAGLERKKYQERNQALEQQFIAETPMQHMALRQAVERAELIYRSQPFHLMLEQIAFDEQCKIRHLKDRTQERIDQDLRTGDPRHLEICRIRDDERRDMDEIRRSADLSRSFVQVSIDSARALKDQSIAAAQERFHFSTASVRDRIDALKLANRQQFDLKITDIDEKFRKSLRG